MAKCTQHNRRNFWSVPNKFATTREMYSTMSPHHRTDSWNGLSKIASTRQMYTAQPTQLVKCNRRNRHNFLNVLSKNDATREAYAAELTQTDATREIYQATPTHLVKCHQHWNNEWNIFSKRDTSREYVPTCSNEQARNSWNVLWLLCQEPSRGRPLNDPVSQE